MNNWVFVFFISGVAILILILIFLIAEKVGQYFSSKRGVGIWESGGDDQLNWRINFRSQKDEAGENSEVSLLQK